MNDDGLEGVVAAHTVLSEVDGAAGRLVIRGHTLDEIARRWQFEDVAAAAVRRLLRTRARCRQPAHPRWARARREAFERLQPGDEAALRRLPAIEAVRALLARLPDGDDLTTALRLLAAPGGLHRRGDALAAGRAGARARRRPAAMPPTCCACCMAAYPRPRRRRRSTPTSSPSATTASTPRPSRRAWWPPRARAWPRRCSRASARSRGRCMAARPAGARCARRHRQRRAGACLARGALWPSGQRLMGFGHRIYRVRDPRADALKGALKRLERRGRRRCRALRAGRGAPSRPRSRSCARRSPTGALETNVEFYTALLLEALGFGRGASPACSRPAALRGWLARMRANRCRRGRLIRPQSVYVGPEPAAREPALAH